MMQILLIDGYDQNSKKGRELFNSFHRTLISSLIDTGKGENELIIRKIDELSDYVCDWEHDLLNEKSKEICQKIDKLDIICIGGDMRISPWEPHFTKVITIIHTANFCNKPILAVGSGSFACIYASATKGTRFHILNGPNGESLDKLPYFPRYSVGSGVYPSAWLDSETGDLYSYEAYSRVWKPICNIGVHR